MGDVGCELVVVEEKDDTTTPDTVEPLATHDLSLEGAPQSPRRDAEPTRGGDVSERATAAAHLRRPALLNGSEPAAFDRDAERPQVVSDRHVGDPAASSELSRPFARVELSDERATLDPVKLLGGPLDARRLTPEAGR